MKRPSLPDEELYERVSNYKPREVTDELYKFGMMMISENLDRTKQLDAKGTLLAGYSGAILAFLVSRQSLMEPATGWQAVLVLLAGISALVAVVSALWALQLRTFGWFSDRDWFKDEGGILEDADRLKRYYILEMHHINRRMGQSNGQKANRIVAGQRALAVTGICLAAAFLAPTCAWFFWAVKW